MEREERDILQSTGSLRIGCRRHIRSSSYYKDAWAPTLLFSNRWHRDARAEWNEQKEHKNPRTSSRVRQK
jgi:hypothetical protein